jgi:hypothetical protein
VLSHYAQRLPDAALEAHGHTLVVTSDKEGEGSTFEKELADADVVISQPFWPAYLRIGSPKRPI